MELTDLLARLENRANLTDDELAELEADLAAAMDALLDGDLDEDALAQAEQVAEGIEAVRAETAARVEAAAAIAERAQALRDRVRVEADNADGPDGDGEPAAADADNAAEGDNADGEPAAEPVAAAARRRPAVTVSRVAARQHPQADLVRGTTPRPQAPSLAFPQWGLTAAAGVPGFAAGDQIDDYDKLAALFASAWRHLQGPNVGPRTYVPLVRAGRGATALYGADRTLDSNTRANSSKIRNVTHPEAIVAAGGFCAPINISYDLPVMGSDARPVRDDMLVRFGADRGGIRTLVPPVLADVAGAIGVWTQADDILAGTVETPEDTPTVTKPCLTIDCPDETESLVYAVTRCFRTGNFRQRFFPEQIEAIMKLIAVAHARIADTALLTAIGTASTAVTAGRVLGTTRDVLANLDMAVSAFRDRWRLATAERLRFGAPRWLIDEMRTDMARALPGTADENLALADARIVSWITSRNVNFTPLMDGTNANQHFAAQGAGALQEYPTMAYTYLYPEGAHLFLDGGTLDFGLVRDSSLNAVNDLMFFAETIEGHHYQGPESLRIAMTTCPDGSIAGTADIDPCS